MTDSSTPESESTPESNAARSLRALRAARGTQRSEAAEPAVPEPADVAAAGTDDDDDAVAAELDELYEPVELTVMRGGERVEDGEALEAELGDDSEEYQALVAAIDAGLSAYEDRGSPPGGKVEVFVDLDDLQREDNGDFRFDVMITTPYEGDDESEAVAGTEALDETDVDEAAEAAADDETEAETLADATLAAAEDTPPVTDAADEPAIDPATDDEPPALATTSLRKTKPAHTHAKAKTAATKTPPRKRGRPRPLTVAAASAAAVALVFGVVSGVVWWRADHAEARTTAVARDEVSTDARLAITTVNTSDYRHPDAAVRNWLEVSTGTLHGEFTDSRAAAVKLLGQAKMVTTAVVLDIAVTKVDPAKGTATVIASLNLKRKPTTGAAATTRNRFRATLKHTGGEWKLSDLALVQAALS